MALLVDLVGCFFDAVVLRVVCDAFMELLAPILFAALWNSSTAYPTTLFILYEDPGLFE